MIEDNEQFADEMRHEHRTIQQLNAPAIFAVLKQWAKDYETGNYDARNEMTCKLAFNLVDAFTKRASRELDATSISALDSLFFPYI